MSFETKNLKSLTSRCGVYCMSDKQGIVLYVGKAKNLKKRVTSYFNRSQASSPKTQAMIKQVEHIDVTVTHTENEALLLENNLIKNYKPRYNILFRDDKSYPYLRLTSDHDYPRFRYYRGALKDKDKYFGPYPNAGSVKKSLNLIQKLFLIRSCADNVFANRARPCLQYQIKRCSAPCVQRISKQDYQRDLNHAMLFLEGKNEAVISALTEPMQRASDALEFELAARFRDQIRALRVVQEKHAITTDNVNLDIISCAIVERQACIQITLIRAGMNLGSQHYFPQAMNDQAEADLIKAFLSHFYLNNQHSKKFNEILVSHRFADITIMAAVLSEQIGHKITIKSLVRGERLKWLKIAMDNAILAVQQRLASNQTQRQRFAALEKQLALKEPLNHLECFDISHTQGEATVGACVVFDQNGPVNSKYRQFNIENVKQGDDYAAIGQTVRRRYTRLIKENAHLPDLILIDGGKGQVRVTKTELHALQLDHIPILGIAKGPGRKPGLENLILSLENKTIHCDSTSPALHLIQHIRDEAHRFAITSHRQRRKKARNRSRLEDIEGIGSKRRQNLIKHFGGLQGIAKAGINELAMVTGINQLLAEKIYNLFHDNA